MPMPARERHAQRADPVGLRRPAMGRERPCPRTPARDERRADARRTSARPAAAAPSRSIDGRAGGVHRADGQAGDDRRVAEHAPQVGADAERRRASARPVGAMIADHRRHAADHRGEAERQLAATSARPARRSRGRRASRARAGPSPARPSAPRRSAGAFAVSQAIAARPAMPRRRALQAPAPPPAPSARREGERQRGDREQRRRAAITTPPPADAARQPAGRHAVISTSAG